MITQLLYQTDSYIKEFQATVTEINLAENSIALDRTAFYPGGGGQPNDIGTIKSAERTLSVTKVKSLEGVVWHRIDGPLPDVGTQVVGQLDWDRRYKLMRTHTALHILCGVIWRDYGAHVTGANIEPLKARMDFELETLPKDLVKDIETKVNLEVQNGRPIQIKILPREEAFKIPDLIRTKINLLPEHIKEVRTVEIVGLDLQADGGTHVAVTKEVGLVKIVDYQSKGKINKRIYIELSPSDQ